VVDSEAIRTVLTVIVAVKNDSPAEVAIRTALNETEDPRRLTATVHGAIESASLVNTLNQKRSIRERLEEQRKRVGVRLRRLEGIIVSAEERKWSGSESEIVQSADQLGWTTTDRQKREGQSG
jgi:hypothetical protein